MRQLEIVQPVGPAARLGNDMIKGRALLFPDTGMRDIKPATRHRFPAKGTLTRLRFPKLIEMIPA